MVFSSIIENLLIESVISSYYLQDIMVERKDSEKIVIKLEHLINHLSVFMENKVPNLNEYIKKNLEENVAEEYYVDIFEKTITLLDKSGLNINFEIEDKIILALSSISEFYKQKNNFLIKNQRIEHIYLAFKYFNKNLYIDDINDEKNCEYNEIISFFNNNHTEIDNTITKDCTTYINNIVVKYLSTSLKLLEETTNNIIVHSYIEKLSSKKKTLHFREDDLYNIIYTLNRRDSYNLFLHGQCGVGKTSLVKSLPSFIKQKKINQFKNTQFYLIDLTEFITNTIEDNEAYENNVKVLEAIFNYFVDICNDESKDFVLCWEVPMVAIDSNEMSFYLKNFEYFFNQLAIFLNRFINVKTIIINDLNSAESLKISNPNDTNMFSSYSLKAPNKEEIKEILKVIKFDYEDYYGIKISDENLDLILNTLNKSSYNINNIKNTIDLIFSRLILNSKSTKMTISNDELLKAIEIDNSISVDNVDLVKFENQLKSVVFGQNHVIDTIVNKFEICKAGLRDKHKPIATYMFSGNSGTGKTELARKIAEFLGVKLLRYDMGEFQETHSISKFLGSPAGYLGYQDGSPLIKDIEENPKAVLLFDEIEKANPSVVKLFLHILEEGTIKGSNGKEANVSNNIIIFTTNAASRTYSSHQSGFLLDQQSDKFYESIKTAFPIEFINRLDDVLYFNELTKEDLKHIIYKELNTLFQLIKQPIKFNLTENALNELLKIGYDRELGARKIRRVIEKEIKLMIAKKINENTNKKFDLEIDCLNGKFDIIVLIKK